MFGQREGRTRLRGRRSITKKELFGRLRTEEADHERTVKRADGLALSKSDLQRELDRRDRWAARPWYRKVLDFVMRRKMA